MFGTFTDVIWHVLSSHMAYSVHMNLESLKIFCGISVSTFCRRYFVQL